MNKFRLLLLLILTQFTVWSLASTLPDLQADARARLLEQIRYGETIYRDDLVQDAVERLLRIDPNAQEALLAQIYLATRRAQMDQAKQYLQRLATIAPASPAYVQGKALIDLTSEDSQRALTQARLFSAVGRVEEARKAYDDVLKGAYPTADLALEYWQLRSREAASRELAIRELTQLNKRYPRHPGTLLALANLSFSDGKPEQAMAYLNALGKISSQRETASAREYEYLVSLPITDKTQALWSDFVSRYSGTRLEPDARAILERQRRLLADPVWRGGKEGVALTDAGEGTTAMIRLQAAVRAYPTDPEFLGALGLAYMRSGDRAQALKYFELAKDNEPRVDAVSRWISLIDATGYWILLEKASQAMERADWVRAQQLYEQAHQQDPGNLFAVVGLGDVALAQKRNDQAWKFYRQAFDLDPSDPGAQRGLQRYLATLTPELALARLNQFPPSQQRYLSELKRVFKIAELENKALAAQAQGNWQEAAQWLTQAQALDLNDPWLSYRLASSLQMAGQPQAALSAYQRHLNKYPTDPTSVYAYGLLLESQDRWAQGMTALDAVAPKQWTPEMHALSERLQTRMRVAQAQTLYDSGDVDGAIALLEQPPGSIALELQVAEWSLLQGRYQKALDTYQAILTREPGNTDARLGELETWAAQGDLAKVRQQLSQTPPKIPVENVNAQRRLAMLWAAAGDREQAIAILNELTQRPGPVSPLAYRDYARLSAAENPQFALENYRKAMIGSGLLMPDSPDQTPDDASFTRAMRTPDAPLDWLQSSIRADASALYRRTNPTLTLSADNWFRNDGTPGLSQLRATTTMMQMDYPIASGVGFLRADYIQMNAGSFGTTSTGEIDERFGTCIFNGQTAAGTSVSLPGCRDVPTQKVDGTAFALGWQDSRWGFDLGRTPSSFPVSNWTGGVNVLGDLGDLGWRLTVSRRPMANSLLSLAGATDPRTGIVWGGVVSTGATLSLSWDKGLADGVWANIGYHKLTGTNVADNTRFRAMAGYYRRIINTPNELLTVGVNAMYWSYAQNLGNFTFGQGGYYSPQMYASIGLPVGYARRWDDWALMLQGSVSVSVASTNDQTYYPLMGAMPGPVNALLNQGATPASLLTSNTSTGGTSTGFGYTLRGALERRVGNHWVLGAAFDLQRGQDFMPSRFMVYLRYFFKPWAGDLQLQPGGLTPYVDFN